MSTDVQLKRHQTAEFPERCVVCGGEEPERMMKISDSVVSWLGFIMFWLPSGRVRVRFPVHDWCGSKLRLRRWVTNSLYWIVLIGAVFLLYPHVKDVAIRPVAKLLVLAGGMIACLPIGAFQVFFPPAFDITAGKETVDYEFADRGYAVEFAELNGELDQGRLIRLAMVTEVLRDEGAFDDESDEDDSDADPST